MFAVVMENLVDLVEQNATLMDQAVDVLARMSDAVYQRRCTLLGGQRIGPQIRHVIEFYECLLNGVDHRRVNYDARRRDPVLESDRCAAITKLWSIRDRLGSDERLREDRALWVVPEGGTPSDGYALSSLGRELEAVESHTVHHFALIAMLLLAAGIQVPENFGVSRATLRYRAQASASAAA